MLIIENMTDSFEFNYNNCKHYLHEVGPVLHRFPQICTPMRTVRDNCLLEGQIKQQITGTIIQRSRVCMMPVCVCALYLIVGEDDRSPGGLHYQGLRHVRNDLNSNHES